MCAVCLVPPARQAVVVSDLNIPAGNGLKAKFVFTNGKSRTCYLSSNLDLTLYLDGDLPPRSPCLAADEWARVATRVNNGIVSVFLNGVQVPILPPSGIKSNGILSLGERFWLLSGQRSGDGGLESRSFGAFLRRCNLYDTCLSDDELAKLGSPLFCGTVFDSTPFPSGEQP
jgi:hypothetical protein